MSAHDEIATAIVAGQHKVMGKVALTLASRATGHDLGTDLTTMNIDGATVDTIEKLIAEYSSVTGPLGVRMCRQAAAEALSRHPDVTIPSFHSLG
jgi:hypothetical protein